MVGPFVSGSSSPALMSTKRYPANIMLVEPCDGLDPIQGGVEIFLVASCSRDRNKLRPAGPLSSYADSM